MTQQTQPMLGILVLDFAKPKETRECLESLRARIKLNPESYQITLLDNGAAGDYSWWLYQEGLCDTLISKRASLGGGVGQTDLFRWCTSPYSLFVQNDQMLMRDLTDKSLADFITLLNTGYECVDLNGDQSGRGAWTDRAHLIKTSFFNSLAPYPQGAPGPLSHLRWNENYLQEHVTKIAHIKPIYFADRGVWTIRDLPDGSRVKMRTDTKQVWWDQLPSETYVFPDMTEAEWRASIAGEWVGGTIPEAYKAHSFQCWGDVT